MRPFYLMPRKMKRQIRYPAAIFPGNPLEAVRDNDRGAYTRVGIDPADNSDIGI